MNGKDHTDSLQFKASKSGGIFAEGKGRHGVYALLFMVIATLICVTVYILLH